jgi:O-antigen ligase
MAEGTISERATNWNPSRAGIKWSAAHNSYLQAGAELGIPGLLVWTSLVVGGVWGMRRLRRRLPPAWSSADPERRFLYLAPTYLSVAFVGFGVSSLFVSFAYLDPIYLLAALVSGLYVAVERVRRADAEPPGPGSRHGTRPTPVRHAPIRNGRSGGGGPVVLRRLP